MTQYLPLWKIKYSQDSINSTFHNGDDVCYANTASFGNMEVVDPDGNGDFYTINNRHLYALKEELDEHCEVWVNLVPIPADWDDKFTTQNWGASVDVRYPAEPGACRFCNNKAAADCPNECCGACCGGCSRHAGNDNGGGNNYADNYAAATGYAYVMSDDEEVECEWCGETREDSDMEECWKCGEEYGDG